MAAMLPTRHRQHGQDHQHVAPFGHLRFQALAKNAHDKGKRGNFGRGADEQRHRGGCAVIDVGHPHVERHRAELECQTGNDEDHAEHQRNAQVGAVLQGNGHVAQRQRAGDAVDHRHAVEQHARGQRAQHEVFHRRLGRDAGVALQGDHGIQRQRQQFEAEIQREEMAGRDHHHHAQHRKQRQHEELAFVQSAFASGSRANTPAPPPRSDRGTASARPTAGRRRTGRSSVSTGMVEKSRAVR